MQSSLPVWGYIMAIIPFIALVVGYLTPYVSAEDKTKAVAFYHNANKEKVPEIKVSPRTGLFAGTIYLLSAATVVAVVLFFVESFHSVAAQIGLGVVGAILGIIAMVIVAVFFFVFSMFLLFYTSFKSAEGLAKHYRRYYGVNAVISDE